MAGNGKWNRNGLGHQNLTAEAGTADVSTAGSSWSSGCAKQDNWKQSRGWHDCGAWRGKESQENDTGTAGVSTAGSRDALRIITVRDLRILCPDPAADAAAARGSPKTLDAAPHTEPAPPPARSPPVPAPAPRTSPWDGHIMPTRPPPAPASRAPPPPPLAQEASGAHSGDGGGESGGGRLPCEQNCGFGVHSDDAVGFGKYCCKKCLEGDGHGKKCEGFKMAIMPTRPAPPPPQPPALAQEASGAHSVSAVDSNGSMGEILALREMQAFHDLHAFVRANLVGSTRHALAQHTTEACQPKHLVRAATSVSLKACGLENDHEAGGMHYCKVNLPNLVTAGDGIRLEYVSPTYGSHKMARIFAASEMLTYLLFCAPDSVRMHDSQWNPDNIVAVRDAARSLQSTVTANTCAGLDGRTWIFQSLVTDVVDDEDVTRQKSAKSSSSESFQALGHGETQAIRDKDLNNRLN